MEFENPIVGEEDLLRNAIRSPGFLSGSTGWRIAQDGSAEFNNVVIRGGTVVSGQALYYDGTPAAGNLIASISAVDGTDVYGNPYYAGICTYDWVAGKQSRMYGSNVFSGPFGSTLAQSSSGGYILFTNTEFGSNKPAHFLQAPLTGGNTVHAGLLVVPGTGGTQTTAPTLIVVESMGNQPCNQRISGNIIKSDLFGNSLTWQTPTPFSANWAGTTTFNGQAGTKSLQYRKDVQDNVVVCGAAVSSGVGTIVAVLPVDYRPVERILMPANYLIGSVITPGFVQITAAGQIACSNAISGVVIAAGSQVFINGSYPLGNLA